MAATSANAYITGDAAGNFGVGIVGGDFNADGKTDLAISAPAYNFSTGRVYVFNGGTISSSMSVSAANVTFFGENANDLFGSTMLAAGDLNADGKTDLIVSARGYSSNAGRVYVYYNNNGLKKPLASMPSDTYIDAPGGGSFGNSLVVGEFSNDGNLDLAVGAEAFSSNAGNFYIYPFEAGPNLKAPISSRGSFKVRGKVKFK
jgi:hypothetical protein